MKFNLKLTSLLAASGELPPSTRKKLLSQVENDPSAGADYRDAHRNFAVFDNLPIPEPSAAQRQYIPAMIKHAIHTALGQREKRAGRAALLIRWASAGTALAACITLAVLFVSAYSQDSRQYQQITRINAIIDRITLAPAVTSHQTANPEAAAPALSLLHNKDGINFNLLTNIPDPTRETRSSDPSAPPGSF